LLEGVNQSHDTFMQALEQIKSYLKTI